MSSYQFINTLGTYPNGAGSAGAGGAATPNTDYYNPQMYNNLVSSYNNYFGQNGDTGHQAPHQSHQAPPPPGSQLQSGAGPQPPPHHQQQQLQAQQLGYCNGNTNKPFAGQNGSGGGPSSTGSSSSSAGAAVAHQLGGQQTSNRTPTPNDCKFSLHAALNHQNLSQLNGLGSLQHNLHTGNLNGLNHNLGKQMKKSEGVVF